MSIESYKSHSELLFEKYISDVSFPVYTSVMIGVFACKTVYDLSQLISPVCFKSYLNLAKSRQIEWSNRAISTFHSIYITIVSLYFVFSSELFIDNFHLGPFTLQSSTFSTCALGVSVGYFLTDLGMIMWCYPSLGGIEYVIHHLLSLVALSYAMLTGQAQIYTYMVLISEATTPWINLRWYFDAAGMKRSKAYTTNGIVIFLAWLVVRILLFIYMFFHVYIYYDQVKHMDSMGIVLVFLVPSVLSVMNVFWFCKIFKGLKKTLSKTE